MKAIIVWGTQLTVEHHSALAAYPAAPVVIIESLQTSRRHRHHKQKIRFILTAMRDYGDELKAAGRTVWYSGLEESDDSWFEQLHAICRRHGVTELAAMRQNDRPPQQRLETWCKEQGIPLEITPNKLFLTSSAEFHDWAEDHSKRLHLEQFYRWQRTRLGILMNGDKPEGGKWNYDSENRQPLPKNQKLPKLAYPKPSRHAPDIERIITKHFADNPGELQENWLPTSRAAAQDWLRQFTDERLKHFGIYEDAMRKGETFLFHSALSALLNIGLLHPSEVIEAVLETPNVPLAGREGFIRQIIGWREFMFGLYHYKPLAWKNENFFGFRTPLPDWWWQLEEAPEPPLTDALERLRRYGYSHHIERLMIFGNYMLLSQYDPHEVYDWFLCMYVDAYEWVMVPNVIGMSQYADGGIDNGGFATKPYISGSNYLQKMGGWWPTGKAAKESDWTGKYWQFLEAHHQKLSNIYRLRPLLKRFEK